MLVTKEPWLCINYKTLLPRGWAPLKPLPNLSQPYIWVPVLSELSVQNHSQGAEMYREGEEPVNRIKLEDCLL